MPAVVTLADVKAHLNITTNTDDDLLTSKIAVAQACVENFIGFKLDDAEEFPDGVPAPILEAVRQYAAHLYENREPIVVGESAQMVPLNVFDLVGPYRRWVF